MAGNFPPSSGQMLWKAGRFTLQAVDARARRHEVVYQDLAWLQQLDGIGQRFNAREEDQGFGPLRILADRA